MCSEKKLMRSGKWLILILKGLLGTILKANLTKPRKLLNPELSIET